MIRLKEIREINEYTRLMRILGHLMQGFTVKIIYLINRAKTRILTASTSQRKCSFDTQFHFICNFEAKISNGAGFHNRKSNAHIQYVSPLHLLISASHLLLRKYW